MPDSAFQRIAASGSPRPWAVVPDPEIDLDALNDGNAFTAWVYGAGDHEVATLDAGNIYENVARARFLALAANHIEACRAALEAMQGEGPVLGHDHSDDKFGHDPANCRLCLAHLQAEQALAALESDAAAMEARP